VLFKPGRAWLPKGVSVNFGSLLNSLRTRKKVGDARSRVCAEGMWSRTGTSLTTFGKEKSRQGDCLKKKI